MKNINIKILILALALTMSGFLLSSCVESINQAQSQTPSIELYSPLTGDTIYVGKNPISYAAADYSGGSGLAQFEVRVNDGAVDKVYTVNTDGSVTPIYIEVDSTFVNTKISYNVIVYNKAGKLKSTDIQKNIYVRPAPPTAPGKLKISKESNNKFNLTWVDSSNNETGFQLWRKDGADGTYQLLKTLAANAFFADDIVPSQYLIYFYKIRAYNANGFSSFSNEVNTNIAPSNLKATAIGASSVDLSWTDNTLFEDGFRIERTNPGTGDWEFVTNVTTNITQYTDQGLSANTTYKYRVAANSSGVLSSWSNEASVTTGSSDVAPPSNLVASFNSTTKKVDVTWSTSNSYTTYVERKEGVAGSYNQIAILDGSGKEYADSNVTNGTIYYYRVRELVAQSYYTSYSNEDSAYVPYLPPDKPDDLRIFSTSQTNTFGLLWNDNSSDEDGFELMRKDGVNGTYQSVQKYAANTIAAYVSVPSDQIIYYFKIRAYKGSLNSAYSNEVNTGSVTGSNITLSLVQATGSYVQLQWTDPYTNEVGFSLERKLSWQSDSEYGSVH